MNRLLNSILFISSLIVILFSVSCEKFTMQDNPLSAADSVKFSRDIKPLLVVCVACHDGSKTPNLKDNPYLSLKSGNYINTKIPSQSPLYITLKTKSFHESRISPSQIQLILQWIKQGARNN